jgi:hypothetical protein
MENDPQVIREEIEATREHLADTAEAIAYKADVPARVKEDVANRIDSAKETAGDVAALVGATLADATQAARENAALASGAAADFVATTRDKAAPLAEKTRSLAGSSAFGNDPLALTLATLAAGFLLGLALPLSDHRAIES